MASSLVYAHLSGCVGCRAWQEAAHQVTRRARLGGPVLNWDLTEAVLSASGPSGAGRSGGWLVRTALLVVALGQLAITVPLLLLGQDREAGIHAAHELGSFDLALAAAFLVGTLRPRLSAGLAWPAGVAAVGLTGTAVADLIGRRTLGLDEAQHLVAVAGALLLFWQARAVAAEPVSPAPAAALSAIDKAAGEVGMSGVSDAVPDDASAGPGPVVARQEGYVA